MISHKHTHKYRITTFMFKTPKFFWPLTAPLDIQKICVLKIFEEICVAVTTTAYNLSVFGVFGPYFPTFELNTEIHEVSLRVQSKCGKIGTGKTPNTDTFQAVYITRQLLERPAKHCFFFKTDHCYKQSSSLDKFFINFENSDAWQSKYLFLYPRRRQEDVLRNI